MEDWVTPGRGVRVAIQQCLNPRKRARIIKEEGELIDKKVFQGRCERAEEEMIQYLFSNLAADADQDILKEEILLALGEGRKIELPGNSEEKDGFFLWYDHDVIKEIFDRPLIKKLMEKINTKAESFISDRLRFLNRIERLSSGGSSL